MASCANSSAQAVANEETTCFPFHASSKSNCIELRWDSSKIKCQSFNQYSIKYKEKPGDTIKHLTLSKEKTSITIRDLIKDTLYRIIVLTEFDDLKSNQLFECEIRTASETVSSVFKKASFGHIETKNGLELYKLQPKSVWKSEKSENVRVCNFISEETNKQTFEKGSKERKSILVVGESGVGKSTMLDSMVNYIAGVSLKDKHRFQIINMTGEELQRSTQQTGSQTSGITCYRIPQLKGSPVGFPLNLIDTPGFKDTRGMEMDNKIPEYLTYLLQEFVEHISAICIVISLSSNRLGDTQKYVIKRVMELFGKDLENNIFVFITHHDGCTQNACLNIFKECKIEIHSHFCFNNGIVFSEYNENNYYFWDKNVKEFENFFQTLENVETKTIKSSLKVMKERKVLKATLENLLQNLRAHIDSGNSRYREFIGKRCINCTVCKDTCHKNCWVPANAFVYFCYMFSFWRRCKWCKCRSGVHKVENYAYQLMFLDKQISDEKEISNCLKVLDEKYEKEKEISDIEEKIIKTADEILDITEKLNTIALAKEKIQFENLINGLISQENEEKQIRYNERVKCLKIINERYAKKISENT